MSKAQELAGKRFVASVCGYTYEWQAGEYVGMTHNGTPYLWATPVRRISGKQGRLRGHYVFLEPFLLTVHPSDTGLASI